MLNPVTRRRGAVAAVSVCALVVGLLGGTGSAQARQAADPLTPRTKFVMKPDGSSGANKVGAAIPNIDSVKATIRTYYAASSDGIADKKKSPYITEIAKLLNDQNSYLSQNAKAAPKPAIVLDVDDTTLWNYDMEDGALHFDYDPAVQNQWVQDQLFPAVPGMAEFVDKAVKQGYTVFGVTGRNNDQEPATLANLTKVGYGASFTADSLYTKWTGKPGSTQPDYIKCATTTCTTVEYKAGTRAHIEASGFTIMLNVGDQWSDLMGGHAKKVLKLPNPTYYLPSPNLPGVSEPNLVPRNVFTMEPDGSSGETVGGEGIPNFDSVVATIRAYYNAPDGHREQEGSRYITEMKKLRDKWAPRLKTRCTNQAALGNRAGRCLRRRRHDAVDLRHGGRGDALQLRPRAPGRVGAGQEVQARPGHEAGREGCEERRLQGHRPHRSRRRPAQGDPAEPAQALRRRLPRRSTTSPSGPTESSRRTSPARSRTSARAWSSRRRRGPTWRRSSR